MTRAGHYHQPEGTRVGDAVCVQTRGLFLDLIQESATDFPVRVRLVTINDTQFHRGEIGQLEHANF